MIIFQHCMVHMVLCTTYHPEIIIHPTSPTRLQAAYLSLIIFSSSSSGLNDCTEWSRTYTSTTTSSRVTMLKTRWEDFHNHNHIHTVIIKRGFFLHDPPQRCLNFWRSWTSTNCTLSLTSSAKITPVSGRHLCTWRKIKKQNDKKQAFFCFFYWRLDGGSL